MKKIFSCLFSMALFCWVAAVAAAAGTPPDIKVSVALDKDAFALGNPSDPVRVVISLENTGAAVIAPAGFKEEDFHLLLQFSDENGNLINATEFEINDIEGGPPEIIYVDGSPVQAESVETIESGWALTIDVPDARAYYALTSAGMYRVKAIVPIRTYSSVYANVLGVDYALLEASDFAGALESNTEEFSMVADADIDGYAYPVALASVSPNALPDCNDANGAINPGAAEIAGDGVDNDCNPSTPDVVVVPGGTINVTAEKHTVGSGSYPSSSKSSIAGMTVKAFSASSGSCARNIGVSWKNYKSIWLSCVSDSWAVTGSDGKASMGLAPGGYVVIGKYEGGSADAIYMGVSADVSSGAASDKYLQLISKADGKIVPAKYTTKTGSLLLIIEPEYVEWSGTEELYPFVFESVGDWTVTTSVSPPEGFVADSNSLSTDVNTDLKATQFTIVDVGSDWVATGVTHKIKHKGKTETVRGEIGVKLSEELAKKKGLGRFGKEDRGKKD